MHLGAGGEPSPLGKLSLNPTLHTGLKGQGSLLDLLGISEVKTELHLSRRHPEKGSNSLSGTH